MRTPRPHRWTLGRCLYIGWLMLAFGVPALWFLVNITWGAILWPVAGLVLLAPFVLVNYLVWGWWLPRRLNKDD